MVLAVELGMLGMLVETGMIIELDIVGTVDNERPALFSERDPGEDDVEDGGVTLVAVADAELGVDDDERGG
jgi:hypothetical protein